MFSIFTSCDFVQLCLEILNCTDEKIIISYVIQNDKKGTLLTKFELGKITGLHEGRKGLNEIAKALCRSYNWELS